MIRGGYNKVSAEFNGKMKWFSISWSLKWGLHEEVFLAGISIIQSDKTTDIALKSIAASVIRILH